MSEESAGEGETSQVLNTTTELTLAWRAGLLVGYTNLIIVIRPIAMFYRAVIYNSTVPPGFQFPKSNCCTFFVVPLPKDSTVPGSRKRKRVSATF